MLSYRKTWTLVAPVCLVLFFVNATVDCLAGEKRQQLTAPTDLPPLQADWKEFVYETITKHGTEKNKEMNVRYLFLDPPVPCAARFKRKGILKLGFGFVTQEGYGGVVLRKMIDSYTSFTRKRKSVEKDATALFYLITPSTGKVEVYAMDQMGGAVVEPPVVTVESKAVHNGIEVKLRAMMSPKATLESAAFRAIADVETFDTWPPYK